MVSLHFESKLASSREAVWDWITSVDGISAEIWPFFQMTAPRHVKNIRDLAPKPGQRLFRSIILLFGVLPVDYSDLTLLEFDDGRGFLEQSPMLSMKLWRHERRIIEQNTGVIVMDQLTFEPRVAQGLVGWFVRTVFTHRHQILRRHFGVVN